MATIVDINDAKANCIAKINATIAALRQLQTTSSPAERIELDDAIDQLKGMREEIRTQELIEDMNSPEMQNALNVINGATANMNAVAENMKTVTKVIANLAAFLGAAGTVLPALRGEA
jgi:hypothetical protein